MQAVALGASPFAMPPVQIAASATWYGFCRNVSKTHFHNTQETLLKTPRNVFALLSVCALLAGGLPATATAHGDVTPQAVDTHTLPQLGPDWRQDNPYRTGPAHEEAQRIGSSAYNQNCARCHGLEAISGGIAPDLRKLDTDCMSLADAKKKEACYAEVSQYFTATVRKGRTRDGRVYMPPFEGVLSQEAVWAIKTYLESRRVKD
ncbi:hypothetical protein LMG18090_01790 [Ralstonia mannitolilytica]|nr:hypothetical protein LMG18090_01790 [Ralstonia mannitolilytica]